MKVVCLGWYQPVLALRLVAKLMDVMMDGLFALQLEYLDGVAVTAMRALWTSSPKSNWHMW